MSHGAAFTAYMSSAKTAGLASSSIITADAPDRTSYGTHLSTSDADARIADQAPVSRTNRTGSNRAFYGPTSANTPLLAQKNVHHEKAGNPYRPDLERGPSGSRYAG
ncbi:Uncharacterised protein [Mycobacteroides abscessus]|nr:Uncharacterised protein [Mycobacteroides abscessus]